MLSTDEYVLTLSCPDVKGVVRAVTEVLYHAGCRILEMSLLGDVKGLNPNGRFFMRVRFSAPAHLSGPHAFDQLFGELRERYTMEATFYAASKRPALMLMVSKHGHCLNDLLYRARSGLLRGEIKAVASNHPDFANLVESYGVPFHHLPLPTGAPIEVKREQEARVQALMDRYEVDLLVLARYMQVLSEEFCESLRGKAINIHHSFLPSFKGAKPYYQAHERGVKLIGATAHYVTPDLDEGPIIEQDVARVDHSLDPEEFAQVGRDVESVVLARAVQWHTEHRVLLNGMKTVVFK